MMWEPLTDEELGEVPNLRISSFEICDYETTDGVSRSCHQIKGMQTCLSVAGEPWWDTFGITKLEFSNILEELTEGYVPFDGEYSLVASWEPSEENPYHINVVMINHFTKKYVKIGWIDERIASDFFLELFEEIIQNNQDAIKNSGKGYLSMYEIPNLTLGITEGLSDFADYEERDEFIEAQREELASVMEEIIKNDPVMKKFLFWLIRYNVELSFSRHMVFEHRPYRNFPDRALTEDRIRKSVQYYQERELNPKRNGYIQQTLTRNGETLVTRGIFKLEFYKFATAAVKEEGLWQCSFNDEYGQLPKWW